jgi:tellurite resistance protein TerC
VGQHSLTVWLGFTALVVGLLVLDLGVLNRRSHVLSPKEAVSWSAGLIALALLFGGFLYWREGLQHALEYYTGYIVELSLSVDNLFVFIVIFNYFSVPAAAQPKVLKWGILGAIVLRFIMIVAGALLLRRFEWILYVFGGILVITGIRMLTGRDERIQPEKNPVIRLARKVLPFSKSYDGTNFFCRNSRDRLLATPLVLVLLLVEWSDLIFAIDSIPAIFSVTRDPFLVYSSNVFAILGLRAMFFVLADAMDRFAYLKPGVALILVLVGIKMTLDAFVHVPIYLSLGTVICILAGSVVLSLRRSARESRAAA